MNGKIENKTEAKSLLDAGDGARGKTPAAKPESTSEQVTYVPGPDDPSTVKWAGHVFHANVPKPVINKTLIEAARGNKFFRVGAFSPSDVGTTEKAVLPKTSNDYRAHVVAWLKRVESADEFMTQWARDAPMREDCEVGLDDYDYLGSLMAPRLAELAKIDGLNELQLAKMWTRHGVNQVPWRVSNPT